MQILFDNYCRGDTCSSLWGFSVYLEKYRLLFDTGSNGRVLLENMRAQGIDVTRIQYLFITHDHWDHIGGIDSILELNADLTIYAPATLSRNHIRDLHTLTKKVIIVGKEPLHLFGELYSTGLLGDKDPEHSLVIADETPKVLTGCGHYGISEITAVAKSLIGKEIRSVMGGFHLLNEGRETILTQIETLKALGVRHVLPTHCTGDLAVELFSKAFAEKFSEGGVGLSLSFHQSV